MAESKNCISVVIPVYNSEEIVFELHKRLTEVLGSLTEAYEIIFVNDCSPDNSRRKLADLADSDPHVKAISLRKNVGYDNAIMAGLRHVRMTYVVVMDDDLQHAPEDIRFLLNEVKKGYDVVYANFPNMQQSVIKNIGSWLNDKFARLVVNKPPGLYISSFKILKKEIAHEIIKYNGPFPYIDGLIFQVTSSFHQVSIEHHKRLVGKGGHGILRSLRIVFNFCTTFSILPLRVLTVTGFLISILTCVFSIILVVWKLWFGINVEGWASLLLGIVLLGGIQLLGIGIVGEYIGRTYMNINRRPQYVIKEILDGSQSPASKHKNPPKTLNEVSMS